MASRTCAVWVLGQPHEKRSHTSRDKTHATSGYFDADVLDDAIMPAVDYRLPGGLSWLEIEHVLSAALAHPRAVGMEVTIFNPRLDIDGKVLSAFVDMLTRAFARK